MKKIPRLSFVTLLPLFALLLSCNRFENIEIGEVQSVRITHVKDRELGLEIDLPVKNPNKVNIHLLSMDVSVLLNETRVGDISLNEKVNIPKMSEKIITVPVDIKMNGIMSNLVTLLAAVSDGSVRLHLEGEMKAGTFWSTRKFPVEFQKTVNTH